MGGSVSAKVLPPKLKGAMVVPPSAGDSEPQYGDSPMTDYDERPCIHCGNPQDEHAGNMSVYCVEGTMF